MEEHRLRHRRFDGGMSDALDRAVFTSGDAVTVVPFDPRAGSGAPDRAVPRRAATRGATRGPGASRRWPGRCDRIEPPEADGAARGARGGGARARPARAHRQLLSLAGDRWPSIITAFVGEADLGGAGGTHGLAEEHEDIRALVVPLEVALEALAAGEISNAPLMLSLYWLDRNAERLRAEWA